MPTVLELRKICKAKKIKGYSKLRKAELIKKCLGSPKNPTPKKSIKRPPRKPTKKKRLSMFDIIDLKVRPGRYTWDEFIDEMNRYYVPTGKYTASIHSKQSYVYPAIGKALEKGIMVKIRKPKNKAKYAGHTYIVHE